MSALREATLPPPTIVPAVRVDRLGELHGRQWVRSGDVEYSLDPRPIRDSDPLARLADGAVYVSSEVAGELVFFRARAYPVGTFGAGGRLPGKPKPRRSRPAKRIDALGSVPALARREASWTTVPLREDPAPSLGELEALRVAELPPGMAHRLADRPAAITAHRPAEPAARGAPAILARLARLHIGAALTPDRAHVCYTAPAGGCPVELRPTLDLIAPLLLGHLRGEPVPCAFGCGREAVTILAGGAPACEVCASEELTPSSPSLRERVGRALRR